MSRLISVRSYILFFLFFFRVTTANETSATNSAVEPATLVFSTRRYLGSMYPYLVFLIQGSGQQNQFRILQLSKMGSDRGVQTQLATQLPPGYQQLQNKIVLSLHKDTEVSVQDDTLIRLQQRPGPKDTRISMQFYYRNPHIGLYSYRNPDLVFFFQRQFTLQFLQHIYVSASNSSTSFSDLKGAELHNSLVFVQVVDDPQHAEFKIHVFQRHDNANTREMLLLSKYFFNFGRQAQSFDIRGFELIKNLQQKRLYLLVYTAKAYCVFNIDRSLDVNVSYCTPSANNIQHVSKFGFDHILIQQEDQSTNMIVLKSRNLISNQSCVFPASDSFHYTQDIVLLLDSTDVSIYDNQCQLLMKAPLPQLEDTFRTKDVSLLRVPGINAKTWIARVRLEFETTQRESYIQFLDLNYNEGRWLPLLPAGQIVSPTVSRCYGLSCKQCSIQPHCQFLENTCVDSQHRPIQLFSNQSYNDEVLFYQSYTRYIFGDNSPASACPTDSDKSTSFMCEAYAETDSGDMAIIFGVNSHVEIGDYCSVFVKTEGRYEAYLTAEKPGLLQIEYCESQFRLALPDTVCRKKSTVVGPEGLKFMSYKYTLLYFKYDGNPDHYKQRLKLRLIGKGFESFAETTIVYLVSSMVAGLGLVLFVLCVHALLIPIKRRLGIGSPPLQYPLNDRQLGILLQSLKTKEYLSSIKYDHAEQQTCSFCLSNINAGDQVLELYCRHHFHQQCFLDWLRLSVASLKCPLCKRPFEEKQKQNFRKSGSTYKTKLAVIAEISEERFQNQPSSQL